MLQYMLDTDICIHVLKETRRTLNGRFNRLAASLCISSITLGELYYGAEKFVRRAENINGIEEFASRLVVLPFSERASAHFAQIRADLEAVGKAADAYDMLIGGHARSEGLIVVTNNAREFKRMPGVRVENWL
jgi:tRNA(fMet)-specific endonuclease VapC